MKKKTIKRQISILVLMIAVFAAVITGINMLYLSQAQTNSIESTLTQLETQTLNSVERGYEDIQNIAASVAYSHAVSEYILETNADKKFEAYQNLEKLLKNMRNLNSSIVDIAVVGEESSINLNGDIAVYKEIYAEAAQKNSICFFDLENFLIRNRVHRYQAICVPVFHLLNADNKFIGVLFVTIDPSAFFANSDLNEELASKEILLLDEEGRVLVGNGAIMEDINDEKSDEKNIHLNYKEQRYVGLKSNVKIMNGTLFTLLNYSAYYKQMASALFNQFAVIILALAITAVILILFLNNIFKSLNKLTELMQRVSSGKRSAVHERIEITSEIKQNLEVHEITTAFNHMMDETNRLNNRIIQDHSRMYELEITNRETEIAFLRSQINPHFLYNTLTLISGMASENMNNGIIEAAKALSNIYRYSITGSGMIAFHEELKITKDYVKIQEMRFEGRFKIKYNIAENILGFNMPKMILQPLVENAITHGLESCLQQRTLEIGANKSNDGRLCLWVADTGNGMKKEQLRKLLKHLHDAPYSKKASKKSGVGLYNVNTRLLLQYGSDEYSFDIWSAPDKGTRVEIKIPSR